MGVSVGDSVGVSVGALVGGMMIGVGVCVGMRVGAGEIVGVGGGAVGVGRLRLRVMRFSTSALSPIKVNRNEMIPFGTLDKFHT